LIHLRTPNKQPVFIASFTVRQFVRQDKKRQLINWILILTIL